MSEYFPASVSDLTPEDFQIIMAQELQRISEKISYNIWSHSFKHITANYNAGAEPYIFADATGGAISVFLPNPSEEVILNVLKKDVSGNAVTLDAGAVNINGATTLALSSQYDSATVYWDTEQWWRVST